MNLKEAFWSKQTDPNESPSPLSPRGRESEAAPAAATSAVGELVNSLSKQRIYREVTLALRTGLRDAGAEFSFLRFHGLRFLLKSLRSVAQFDSSIILFFHTQSIPELQVVPVLFELSLKETEDDRVGSLDHIFSMKPMKIKSPSTDAEVDLALRVLEGCCLRHPESTHLAHRHNAILDSEVRNGIEEVADLIRDKQVDENLRLKCGEFLLLLIEHVNGRQRSPMATIHEDVR